MLPTVSPSVRTLLAAALLALTSGCGGDAPSAEVGAGSSPLTVARRTPVWVADVVRAFPHDTSAYTQGLQWHNGQLYESTGQVGRSSIRRVVLETGDVVQRRDLAPPHFGEGIVILGDRLYQLTWQSGVAFVYDARTFAPISEFRYTGEGWGLTSDGTQLYMSDGGPGIRVLDPATFAVQRVIAVTENGTPVRNLNELEWVKGEIWANVWTTDRIARIDPQTGAVVGWIDLTGLLPQSLRHGREDVLNGIAYDAEGDRIFVTGKNWARLFEITLRPRP
jgi:glutaminyl-peptide cyclotransferase